MTGDAVTIREIGPGEMDDTVWAMLEPVFRAGDTYAVDSGIPREAALAYWFAERVWVASLEGAPVGTFYIRENQKGGGAHLCNAGFVTDPAARGRGVARAMLDHALSEARALGFRGMVFNFVVATNTRAIDTWRRAGFEEVGRVPGAFRHPSEGFVDALILYRLL
ncbi:GNAT family N-acetyltransferase [Jannaschia aquimarina]|uniref:Acetyltransferase (GNAT) family protein n=1 Tax=Jannaschia aquimarina TaxID=935700 RepID=A0A0D1EAU6_9RHOB|nr:GNAT family N-acetyltransferase [Jannaschia aquimarina]KIT14834.1 Acetyltransferase (GNAT) family protein [Jannaschia aquimarina]SNS57176.1 Ribosomal protein S18 acetylase RimI [Jannaschia aquimarina]